MSKKVSLFFLLFFSFCSVFAQDKKIYWVDSVFQTLSPEDKIGQLFMISVSANDAKTEIINRVKDQRIGGILITGGGPMAHAHLVNQLQQQSKVPLLIGMHAEWGVAQTLDSTI